MQILDIGLENERQKLRSMQIVGWIELVHVGIDNKYYE